MKRSHVIALAGISCALALLSVVGSMFVEFMTLTFLVLSAIFISMPLTQKYWLGGILAYVATSIFAFLIGNINSLPFIIFFGAYAIIQWFVEQKLQPLIKNKIVKYSVAYLIKLSYFEAVIAVFWFLFNSLIPTFAILGNAIELTYMIIALAGIPLFLLYDIVMHYLFKNFTFLINKIVSKTTKTTTPDDVFFNSEQEKKETPFDDVCKKAEKADNQKNISKVDNCADDNIDLKGNSSDNNQTEKADFKENSSGNNQDLEVDLDNKKED